MSLRLRADAVSRARAWRFYPAQTVEKESDTLLVRFRVIGLREIAEHVFT